MGSLLMVKKKPGPKPTEGVGRTVVTNIRSTPAWREWLVELAEFQRLTVADVIDQAVVAYARQAKFPKPIPKR
jgi:hypothetical protein